MLRVLVSKGSQIEFLRFVMFMFIPYDRMHNQTRATALLVGFRAERRRLGHCLAFPETCIFRVPDYDFHRRGLKVGEWGDVVTCKL